MKLNAAYRPYQLTFKSPVLTSRGSMPVKNGFFLEVGYEDFKAIGEVSIIEGLSVESLADAELCLRQLVESINSGASINSQILLQYPSVNFAYECIQLQLRNKSNQILFNSDFTLRGKPIPINGLIWMGSIDFMLSQMHEKLKAGFRCIKLKIGALPFSQEVEIISELRKQFNEKEVELRLDANGAFTEADVFHKLEKLAEYQIHSMEQPVKHGQPELMSEVIKSSPIAIALDEELIYWPKGEKADLLAAVKPAYLVLKPGLLGGFSECDDWIAAADSMNIQWWATSALESNIGLSAIAQWVATKQIRLVQGLGTGSLYKNNIPSSLRIDGPNLYFQ